MKIRLINERNPKYTPTEQVLVNRGIPYEDIEHYLNLTDDDIESFNDLDNIKEAVKMMFHHLGRNNRILIQVD